MTWVREITHVRTAEAWLYVRVVIDFHRKPVAGSLMSSTQNGARAQGGDDGLFPARLCRRSNRAALRY